MKAITLTFGWKTILLEIYFNVENITASIFTSKLQELTERRVVFKSKNQKVFVNRKHALYRTLEELRFHSLEVLNTGTKVRYTYY